MMSSLSLRAATGLRCSPVAIAALLALNGIAPPVAAQARQPADALDPVVVTATRTPQLLQTAPIGASIITAEQIERAGVADANEAVRRLGGVVGKPDLSSGREQGLDLRGFGATADQNLVVVVDGIRLSENEQRSARLSAIPVEQIERIEIIRGGASVLWGEGASAGVINVILKHDAAARASGRVSASLESFDGRDVRAGGSVGFGKATLEASLRHLGTDGYRDNSHYQQDTGSVGVRWADHGWRAGFRVQHEDQDGRLPASLSYSQFAQNPRQTTTPYDFYRTQETLYVADVAYSAGPWTMALDLGHKDSSTHASYGQPASVGDTDRWKRQVSPRISYATQWQQVSVNATAGVDWQHWRYDSVSAYDTAKGRQINQARYAHFDLGLPTNTRLSGGLRWEHVSKDMDALSSLSYDTDTALKASEFGINQTVIPGLDIYGRAASSYRLANVDDNGYPLVPGVALRPQKNRDRELGVKWRQAGHSATLRWFRQTTVDEIGLAPDGFGFSANTNFDPTQRRGYELEGRWEPFRDLTLSATWQELTATYRKGPYAGNEQVLVAPRSATVRASYRVDEHQSVEAGIQYLAAMRIGDDFDNQCSRKIPESTRLDARYTWSDRLWSVALSGLNLTDENGYNYAYRCATGAVYPEAGRLLKVTVSRQF